jgi:hypothetical protein
MQASYHIGLEGFLFPMSKFEAYGRRNHILRDLGFESYRAYQLSNLWQAIRQRVFREKGHECFMCRRFATQVHHNKYTEANLAGRSLKHLAPICGGCHHRIEITQGGAKRPLAKAKQSFNKGRARKLERQHAWRQKWVSISPGEAETMKQARLLDDRFYHLCRAD